MRWEESKKLQREWDRVWETKGQGPFEKEMGYGRRDSTKLRIYTNCKTVLFFVCTKQCRFIKYFDFLYSLLGWWQVGKPTFYNPFCLPN